MERTERLVKRKRVQEEEHMDGSIRAIMERTKRRKKYNDELESELDMNEIEYKMEYSVGLNGRDRCNAEDGTNGITPEMDVCPAPQPPHVRDATRNSDDEKTAASIPLPEDNFS